MNFLWALYAREVRRFSILWLDTIMGPIMSVVLYVMVFGVVTRSVATVGNIPYITFVYAGLMGMMVVNSSFSNPAFSFVISKNMGSIIDLQLVPIRPWKVGIAYALAALTRAVVTLVAGLLLTGWFIPSLQFRHPLWFVLSIALGGLTYGMLGVIFGLVARAFDSLTFMMTFVLQPLIFFAGVFYPVTTSLSAPWSMVALCNPIFHLVNLTRYSLTGYAEVQPMLSLAISLVIALLLFVIMWITANRKIPAN